MIPILLITHTVSTRSYVHEEMLTPWWETGDYPQVPMDYYKIIRFFNILEEDIKDVKKYLRPWFQVDVPRIRMG